MARGVFVTKIFSGSDTYLFHQHTRNALIPFTTDWFGLITTHNQVILSISYNLSVFDNWWEHFVCESSHSQAGHLYLQLLG